VPVTGRRNLELVIYTTSREETEAADHRRPGGESKPKVARLPAASVSSRHTRVWGILPFTRPRKTSEGSKALAELGLGRLDKVV